VQGGGLDRQRGTDHVRGTQGALKYHAGSKQPAAPPSLKSWRIRKTVTMDFDRGPNMLRGAVLDRPVSGDVGDTFTMED